MFTTAAVGLAALAAIPVRGDTVDAGGLRAEVDRFVRKDQESGGAALLQEAYNKLGWAQMRLETSQFDEKLGPDFAQATGNLAVMVGWLAYDANNHALARQCYVDAMALGSFAHDDELLAHTCLYRALQTVRLSLQGVGSPDYALQLTERARDLTHGMPSGRIHALVAAREANAHAVKRDKSAFLRAMVMAWREMDRAAEHEPLEQCSMWLRFVNHAEIASQEAKGYADLGEWSKAAELHRAVIANEAGTRNAVNYRSQLATALVNIGDVSGAIAEAASVLEQLGQGVSSTRTLHDLLLVRKHSEPHASAHDFRDRFDQLAAKLAVA